MVSHLLLPMHVTKALGQTILLVRVVWEESGTYPSTFDNIFWQQYWFFVNRGRNTPGFLYKRVPYLLFIQHVTHTFKWMHCPITSDEQQHHMVFAAFLLTHSHSSLRLVNLAQQLQSKATVLLVLTHLISSTFSTFGSIMLEGRVLDCKSTSRSSSARPLDTEFILTHFSAWPKSNSSRVFTMLSLASLYSIYEFRCTRKEKESIFSIDRKIHWEENLLKSHGGKARQPV